MHPDYEHTENAISRKAFCYSLFLHLAAVMIIVFAGFSEPDEPLNVLAVMDFVDYDPLGGEGGGEGTEALSSPAPMAEAVRPKSQEEMIMPAFYPEVDQPVEPVMEDEFPDFIQSNNETAVPVPPPPPKVKEKPKPKPQQTASKQAPDSSQANPSTTESGTGQGQKVANAGGGPGQGQGGTGGGTGRGTKNLLDAYISKIRQRMDRSKKYPREAQARNHTGVVQINFTINSQGQVSSAKIVSGSGHSSLDDEVLALVNRVSPFTPIPPELGRNTLNLTIPVQFSGR